MWPLQILLPITGLLLPLCIADMTAVPNNNPSSSSSPQTISSYKPRVLGETDGCYNFFEPLLVVDFPVEEVLSNAGCQTLCSDNGFSVSATSARRCLCGNTLPAIFHKLSGQNCDNPCSPDQETCRESSCCGSVDGTFFTVSFAGELDAQKQLLRRLAYSYRYRNPSFRQYINSMLAQVTSLQILQPKSMASSSSSSSSRTTTKDAVSIGYLGMGGGCPAQWKLYGDSCYRKITGNAMSWASAQSACATFGGNIASIESGEHNQGVKQTMGNTPAWIGLSAQMIDNNMGWEWSQYSNWEPGQPDSSGRGVKAAPYGPFIGGAFDDYRSTIASINTIIVGYTRGSIAFLQVAYNMLDGTVTSGQPHGSLDSRGIATANITLSPGDLITTVQGIASSKKLENLAFEVIKSTGERVVYGPYAGNSDAYSFIYKPIYSLQAMYGRTDDKEIYQIGFYEYQRKSCVVLSNIGLWDTAYCDDKYGAPFWVCERGPAPTGQLDCPQDWTNLGSSCVRAYRGYSSSWNDARANCSAQGARLGRVDSLSVGDTYWGLMEQGIGFVGLHDVGGTGNPRWVWDRYENWDVNQPVIGRPPTSSMCVQVDATTKKWSTVDCLTPQNTRPVCETRVNTEKCTCPAGWTVFACSCYQASLDTMPLSWMDANTYCTGLGGTLVSISNNEENDFVTTKLLGGTGISYVYLRDLFETGYLRSQPYLNWGGGTEPLPIMGNCIVMKPDGYWYSYLCSTSQVSAVVCRIPHGAISAYVGSKGQQYELQIVDEKQIQWGKPLDVRIFRVDTGDYLTADYLGNVVAVQGGNSSSASIFHFNVLKTGQNLFTIKNKLYGSYLTSDPTSKTLKAVTIPSSMNSGPNEADAYAAGTIGGFTSSTLVPALAYQYLQISTTAKGSRSDYPLLCSMFIYDLTADTESYTCYAVTGGDMSQLPYVSLEVSAWLINDKTNLLTPRQPLDFGRLACENTDSKESMTCVASYGEGLQYQWDAITFVGGEWWQSFQIDFAKDIPANINQVGGYYNFLGIFSTTYTHITEIGYTTTNTYQASIPVPPLQAVIAQFWLSYVNVGYVWNVILSVVGSFQMSSMGINLGQPRSVTQVMDLEELFFYGWGKYSFPNEGEIILTVDNLDSENYHFCGDESGGAKASCIPAMSNLG